MIFIQNDSGLCQGLIDTLNNIYEIYENNPNKKIYIYNNFINNSIVISELNNLGIEIIDDLSSVNKEDIIIINTYGVSPSIIDYLKKNKIQYIDTTCKSLKTLRKEVLKNYDDNKEIVIINNEYSKIINNWLHNKGLIINIGDDINLNVEKNTILIVSYGYPDLDKIKRLEQELKNKYPEKLIQSLVYNCEHLNRIKKLINENRLTKKILISQPDEELTNSFNNISSFIKYVLNSDLQKNDDITFIGSANTTIKELYNYKYLLTFLLFYKEKLQIFKNKQDEFNETLKSKEDNFLVQKVINDISYLNKDGKYIRGTLISLGEYLANPLKKDYLSLAYAYELFQTSILIHDDIIDNAKLRRGKSTIPHKICSEYLNNKNTKIYHKDTLSLANSIGICAGDIGFYLANKIIINNYNHHSKFKDIINYYNDIVIKTIKGEVIDVYMPFLNKYNYYNALEKDILEIYHLKTSWYTIIGPFTLGYMLGGKKISNELTNILNKIGLAFQIKDDILGIYGSVNDLGKQNTLDSEEFKQTLLYSYIINTSYKNEFLKIYGKKMNSKKLNKLRELLYISGSYDYVNNYLSDLYSEIIDEINNLEINEEGKDIIKGLLIYILEREK